LIQIDISGTEAPVYVLIHISFPFKKKKGSFILTYLYPNATQKTELQDTSGLRQASVPDQNAIR